MIRAGPKRCEAGEAAPVGFFGECLWCDADQGETCRRLPTMLSREASVRRQKKYSRSRIDHREAHPIVPGIPWKAS